MQRRDQKQECLDLVLSKQVEDSCRAGSFGAPGEKSRNAKTFYFATSRDRNAQSESRVTGTIRTSSQPAPGRSSTPNVARYYSTTTLSPSRGLPPNCIMMSARFARAGLRATQFSVARPAAVNGMRSYATAQEVRAPVALFGVDGTYATALYTASSKSSALDQTARAIATLGETLKADPKLINILGAPTLTNADKKSIVEELAKVAGADKAGVVQNFLETLAENNRLGSLNGVCEKFATLMGAHRGEIDLNITSAQELDAKTLTRLEKAVAKSEYSQGQKLKVVAKVDPALVGGLVVEIGGRTVDLSVSAKIAKMNKALTDAL
ncbi:unnamed protein product [Penicillium bialowiezense]